MGKSTGKGRKAGLIGGAAAVAMIIGGLAGCGQAAQRGATAALMSQDGSLQDSTLFQLHTDHSIWVWTGTDCDSGSCPGWALIDSNPHTRSISAGAGVVYQLHDDGSVWEWLGGPCASSTVCRSWIELDNNPATVAISAGSDTVFQLHGDGSIWKSTEAACRNGSCPGWAELDGNPATAEIAASGLTVFQRHKDGTVWRWNPPSCGPQGCQAGVVPGSWQQLGNGSVSAMSIVTGTDTVYALTPDRWIYRWGNKGCSGTSCDGWTAMDIKPQLTLTVTAGGTDLYQQHRDGTVLQSTGDPCTAYGASCLGWTQLGGSSASAEITASASTVFRMLLDGSIWRGDNGQWREIDNNQGTLRIVASNAT